MKKIIYMVMAATLVSCGGGKEQGQENKKTFTDEEIKNESARANTFFDSIFDAEVSRDPNRASTLGIKSNYDKWTDISDANANKENEFSKLNIVALHRNFVFDKLDAQTKISYRLFEHDNEEDVANFKWRFHTYAITQMGGPHSEIPAFLINIHTIDNQQDAEAYIARLKGISGLFDQVIENLKLREAKNIIPPKFVFPYVISDCKNMIAGAPFEKVKPANALLDDFIAKVYKASTIDNTARILLIADVEKALIANVKPAYEKLMTYWNELEKKSTTDDGAWKLPDGDAFYADALKITTTTDMSADEIFALGETEVARIHNEMKEIMKKVNFKSDKLSDFFDFMRVDKQFYYPNTKEGKEAYRVKAVKIIDDMKQQLDKLFLTKPKADIVVKPVEAFREKSAGGAFYNEPALDGSRPGTYYINLYDMSAQATYQMEALAYHEGIPGHHMQIAIAQELQNLPKFRKNGGNTAYVEGWALYSEKVPKEIGFYEDPYSDFGRLAMELFRAARLVVDVGIHKKRWTRQEALNYFKENTPNPESDNQKEIERYIVWPSQATGYKIGMNKIIELREFAKKELGDKFDIREFHDVILTSGPLTMGILEELVKDWVKGK